MSKLSKQNKTFARRPLVLGLSLLIFATYSVPMIVATYLKWGEIGSRPIGILVMFYGMGIFGTVVASTFSYLHFKAKAQKD